MIKKKIRVLQPVEILSITWLIWRIYERVLKILQVLRLHWPVRSPHSSSENYFRSTRFLPLLLQRQSYNSLQTKTKTKKHQLIKNWLNEFWEWTKRFTFPVLSRWWRQWPPSFADLVAWVAAVLLPRRFHYWKPNVKIANTNQYRYFFSFNYVKPIYLCDKLELSESTGTDAAAAARCLGEKYDVILLEPTVFAAFSFGTAASYFVCLFFFFFCVKITQKLKQLKDHRICCTWGCSSSEPEPRGVVDLSRADLRVFRASSTTPKRKTNKHIQLKFIISCLPEIVLFK